jgi:hypothetical protein
MNYEGRRLRIADFGVRIAEYGGGNTDANIQHRTSKEGAARKRSFVTGRSEVVLCLSQAIVGERLHFGIRSFGFRRGPRAITLAIRRKLNRRKPLTLILIYL